MLTASATALPQNVNIPEQWVRCVTICKNMYERDSYSALEYILQPGVTTFLTRLESLRWRNEP